MFIQIKDGVIHFNYKSIKENAMRIIVLTTLLSLTSFVTSAQQQQQGRGKRKPPREAIDACTQLKSGASCSFEHRSRSMTGVCFTPKSDRPLACKPSKK